MRIKFNQPKGSRIKNSGFTGLTTWCDFNWCEHLEMWIDNDKCYLKDIRYSSHNSNIKTLRSAIRHLNKHKHYLPKRTCFTLRSKWVGYDIEIII